MEKLSDYLNNTSALDAPGTYEFYELETNDENKKRFIIKNIINSKSILIQSIQNKVEIDQSFTDYNTMNGKKISIIQFFERLKGLGVNYI